MEESSASFIDGMPSSSKYHRLSSSTDHWLASFPFNRLPIELQIHIGRFTLEHKGYWVFFQSTDRRKGRFRCSLIKKEDPNRWRQKDVPNLGLAHACHALHAPLIQHFFQANDFLLNFVDKQFYALIHQIGTHHIAMIRTVKLVDFDRKFLHHTIKGKEPYIKGVSFIEVHEGERGRPDVEEHKLNFKWLFSELPRLKEVNFLNFLDTETEWSEDEIAGLRLKPGARGRGEEDVIWLFGGEEDYGQDPAL